MWYKMLLVEKGLERIRIVRRGKIIFDGGLPAGTTRHLTIGDSVLVKRGSRFIRKFYIRMWYGRPALRFGADYGNRRNHQVYLSSFPHIPHETRRGKQMKHLTNKQRAKERARSRRRRRLLQP